MEKHRNNSTLSYQDKVFNELYSINTYVNMILTYCQEHEFKGEYYGISKSCISKLSDERNEYITMLSLISDKLAHLLKLNINLEEKITLQEYSNNSR